MKEERGMRRIGSSLETQIFEMQDAIRKNVERMDKAYENRKLQGKPTRKAEVRSVKCCWNCANGYFDETCCFINHSCKHPEEAGVDKFCDDYCKPECDD